MPGAPVVVAVEIRVVVVVAVTDRVPDAPLPVEVVVTWVVVAAAEADAMLDVVGRAAVYDSTRMRMIVVSLGRTSQGQTKYARRHAEKCSLHWKLLCQ